jgi:hypothetical protein
MHFARVFSRLSVRARIIVLGVIPIISFLANGFAFLSGDGEVGKAFDSVNRNTVVPDASRDLKTGLLMMRAATVEFVAHPSDTEVQDFEDGRGMAMRSLDRIQSALPESERDMITPLRTTVRDLKTSFASLVHEQKSLGFTDMQGVTANLIAASDLNEKIIHDDLTWVAEVDSARLLMSLLTLRRYEIEYRLTRNHTAERHFLDEISHFNEIFESVDGAPAMKEKLNQEVQNYSYAFAQWVASTDNIAPLLSLISHDTENVLPEANNIIAKARQYASVAAEELAASRIRPAIHPLGRSRGDPDRARLQLAHRAFHYLSA